MPQVPIDPEMRRKLLDLRYPLELVDESGRVVARVTPKYDPAEYENLEPEISEEELQERRDYKGRMYTTAEVLAYLESL